MYRFRLFLGLQKHAWKSICQQFMLLAVLSMLFLALSLAAGPMAERILTQGTGFTKLQFAVCAPEGDSTAQLVEELTGRMRDIREYASFRSMGREEAEAALAEGDISAVLVLPKDFLGGVLDGTNPDVTLIVSREKPLEALLAWWVGRSAADLIGASQLGIYAVLDAVPPEQYGQAMTEINLRFINTALDRERFFRLKELRPVDAMDMRDHYSLSLLVFLVLASAPAMVPLFSDTDTGLRRRLLSLGYGSLFQYGSTVCTAFLLLLPMTLIPVLAGGWNVAGALMLALLGAAFTGFCCLLSRSVAGCGGIALTVSAVMLFLSGGLLPTPLLPEALQKLGALSPVAALRGLLYAPSAGDLLRAGLWTLGLLAAGSLLYGARLRKGAAE